MRFANDEMRWSERERERDLWGRRKRKRLGVQERRGRMEEEASPDLIGDNYRNSGGKEPQGATGRRRERERDKGLAELAICTGTTGPILNF